DLVLGALIPRRPEPTVAGLDGGGELRPIPRLEDGQEDVVALPGHVAPARGTLLVHRHRLAVDPEEVQGEGAQELEAPAVGPGLDTRDDVRLVGRLFLEIALDHRRELIEGLEHREVELGEEALGEDDPAVAVDDEWLHAWPPGARLAEPYRRPRGLSTSLPGRKALAASTGYVRVSPRGARGTPVACLRRATRSACLDREESQ